MRAVLRQAVSRYHAGGLERTWQLNLRSTIIFCQPPAAHAETDWADHYADFVHREAACAGADPLEHHPAGVMGLVRSLAGQFGRDGITINNVGPGSRPRTDRAACWRLGKDRNVPLEQVQTNWSARFHRPDGKAGGSCRDHCWLASESAASITGQTILVDGGAQGL